MTLCGIPLNGADMSSLSAVIKSPQIITLPSSASTFEAVQKMSDHMIGSIVVMDGESLVGIFTERDLLNRVVAKGIDPKEIALSEVMSKNVKTVSIQESVESCFNKMEDTRCRHIPVVDGTRVVGVVTMRNILEWLTNQMKEENVFLKNYIQT